MASIAELTVSDSVSKVGVFQPDGNKSVENFAWNRLRLLWFSVIRQIKVDNDKTSTYWPWPATTRASKAYSNLNLRPRNIVKKGTT